jgi:hypothetical protein
MYAYIVIRAIRLMFLQQREQRHGTQVAPTGTYYQQLPPDTNTGPKSSIYSLVHQARLMVAAAHTTSQ